MFGNLFSHFCQLPHTGYEEVFYLDFVEKEKLSHCWLMKKHVELIVWQSFLFNCAGWYIRNSLLLLSFYSI